MELDYESEGHLVKNIIAPLAPKIAYFHDCINVTTYYTMVFVSIRNDSMLHTIRILVCIVCISMHLYVYYNSFLFDTILTLQ